MPKDRSVSVLSYNSIITSHLLIDILIVLVSLFQGMPPHPAVPTTLPPQPSYAAPPPGYGQVYSAPPPHIPPPTVHQAATYQGQYYGHPAPPAVAPT